MAKQDPQHQSAPLKQPQPYMTDPKAKPASTELAEAVQQIADRPEAKPATEPQVPAKSNSQIEAERNITRRLMEAALQEIRILERPWDQLTEDQQDEVIHRVRLAANEVTAEVIATVAAGASRSRAIVEIVSVGVKAKVTDVKLQLKSTDPAVHAIIGARGEQAVLVIGSDPYDYGVGKDGITSDKGQQDLPIE